MAGRKLRFLITEHPPAITSARARHYDHIRQVLEGLVGVPVHSQHYVDAKRLHDASAVVLSGSFAPWAVHDPAALRRFGRTVMGYAGPVLGICAGMQLQVMFAGGAIGARERPEVGFGPIEVIDHDDLLSGLGATAVTYKHHANDVIGLPDDFTVLARSAECAVEAIGAAHRGWWGTQFHPERFTARHPDGARVLRNFFALAGLASPARPRAHG
jgi:GMP synthase (glutamine-hydrolysing)